MTMSASPQHGRRRATPDHAPASSLTPRPATARGSGASRHAGASGFRPAQRMAVIAVAGALIGGAGLAQATATPPPVASSAETVQAAGTSFAWSQNSVSAPKEALIDFASVELGASVAAAEAAAAALQSQAEAVAAVPVDDPAAAKAFAASAVAARGWDAGQMSCLSRLWERESSWLTSAENPSSGAYGIAQSLPASKMESVGSDWATNAHTQITWGLTYISARYGTPCGAWAHSEAVNWY